MAGMDILASAFSGANAAFLADLYARWASDPSSVDASFADLFAAMNDEARSVLEDASGASWAPAKRYNSVKTDPGERGPKLLPSTASKPNAPWSKGDWKYSLSKRGG